jgi:hypothetical protein
MAALKSLRGQHVNVFPVGGHRRDAGIGRALELGDDGVAVGRPIWIPRTECMSDLLLTRAVSSDREQLEMVGSDLLAKDDPPVLAAGRRQHRTRQSCDHNRATPHPCQVSQARELLFLRWRPAVRSRRL